MKARPEKPEIVEAAKEWESREEWKGDYCSSIKLTSFSFKWLAQLVNQLEVEEVMEVERQVERESGGRKQETQTSA